MLHALLLLCQRFNCVVQLQKRSPLACKALPPRSAGEGAARLLPQATPELDGALHFWFQVSTYTSGMRMAGTCAWRCQVLCPMDEAGHYAWQSVHPGCCRPSTLCSCVHYVTHAVAIAVSTATHLKRGGTQYGCGFIWATTAMQPCISVGLRLHE